jgi:hypothetical protein
MAHDPDDDSADRRSGDFRAARIGAASALTGVVVILLVADVVTGPDYDVNPMVLVSLLGTVMTLLGIEALNLVRGGK